MNLIFMRHGEASDNVKELISDKIIYWSTLTEEGKKVVAESIENLPFKIDKFYVSPFPRTIQTANMVYEKYKNCDFIIDDRLHEIYHGKYSGQKNNKDLDNTRIKQINNDFFVRFGDYGENKYDIELRLCSFLEDLYKNNFNDNTIGIVSHGSITSFMKRILKLDSPHLKTGKIEEFLNVDFTPLFVYSKYLKSIRNKQIKARKNMIANLDMSENVKSKLELMVEKEFNNLEFPDEVFANIISGLSTNNLKLEHDAKFNKGVILVCFYNDFENFAEKWINHYIDIGIENFVMIDNNSRDNSRKIIDKYSGKVNISFWSINEQYNCYKMCGWKQKILEFYGKNHYYLTVDSDELFIYEGYKEKKIQDFINENNIKYIKSVMMDVYSKEGLNKTTLGNIKYVDKGTYKIVENVPYRQRVYGGPRYRVFGIKPSLQKIPLIYYTGNELYINDHYYYPWNINYRANICTVLLHYKFLPGDVKKYEEFAKDGRHWNNSREYKVYCENIKTKEDLSFYDKEISINIDDIDFNFN